MNNNKSFQVIYFTMIFLYALVVIWVSDRILPDKYFYDANTIRRYFSYSNNFTLGDSFANTARFYKLFGFDHLNLRMLEGYFSYLFIYICLISIFKKANAKLTLNMSITIFIWNTLFCVYLGQLSKDVIAFITITIVLLLFKPNNRFRIILIFIILLGYALIFRTYWFIFIYFIFLNYITYNNNRHFFKHKGIKIVIYFIAILIPFIVADQIGEALTNARTAVNTARVGSVDANTLVMNILPNNNFFQDLINWLYSLFIFILPVNLLFKLNGLAITFLFWNFLNIILVLNILKSKFIHNKNYVLLFVIIVSYYMTQALFEPDLGSFLRHQLVITQIQIFIYLQYEKDKLTKRNTI